jgi:DNA-dependent RNA polymerase auxiliary subunit epsilon
MDIVQQQKDRSENLEVFQKEYNQLKVQYTTLLNQAIHEQDKARQSEFIKQILSVNSNLAQHVREFIQESQGKFDPKLITKLTNDILNYQKEYKQIQNAANKSQALRGILNKEKNELDQLHSQFNIWLGILLGGIGLLLLLIFRTSLVQLSQAAESLVSSTSTIEMEDSAASPLDEIL